jgi:hypothetical protein
MTLHKISRLKWQITSDNGLVVFIIGGVQLKRITESSVK